jgi:hypothetical protein
MKNKAKSLIMTAIALSALGFQACAPFRVGNIRIGNTHAARIAKDQGINGKGSYGQCLPFALALHEKFQVAGIPSKVIAYSYETLTVPVDLTGGDLRPLNPGEKPGTTGAHAIVAYEDDGRTYVMDNQSWMPQWVRNATPAGLAQQFSGMDVAVLHAKVVARTDSAKGMSPAGLPKKASRLR